MQKKLTADQVSAFYHDEFVSQQIDHFEKIALPSLVENKFVVDVGGGCGFFSSALEENFKVKTRVIDTDLVSLEAANKRGVEAIFGDALQPEKKNDECIVCFNLILHHLVGSSEKETLDFQMRALTAWKNESVKIFVNEYIYESWIKNFSGWLIYQITKNKFLSAIGNFISKFVPSLRANTFGVGVRFRSNSEWIDIFKNAGFIVEKEIKGDNEFISLPRKILLIKEIRRDSFLLTLK